MLLKKAETTMAYFKCGIFGFQGSGKTYTSSLLAIGIGQSTGNRKTAFFDTETGSDFLLPKLNEAGAEVFQVKSRSFSDLLQTIRECESEGVGVLIIDSITHVWRELCEAYDKKLKRSGRLQFQDWAKIKGEWREYTDAFVNSRVHIIVCGRAGYDYDYDFNEDGSKDLIKTGTKMKVEGEFGFEPSLVLEMERLSAAEDEVRNIKLRAKKQAFSPKAGSKWIHRCHVLKDRTDRINGEVFDYPTFENFRPHFEALNIGGEHFGLDTTRSSEDRFDASGDGKWRQRAKQVEICLEEIQAIMTTIWPGATKEEKKSKLELLDVAFNTRSWTKVTQLPLEVLEDKLATLRTFEQLYKDDLQQAWADSVDAGRDKVSEDVPY